MTDEREVVFSITVHGDPTGEGPVRTTLEVKTDEDDDDPITHECWAAAAANLLSHAARKSPDGYEMTLDVIRVMAINLRRDRGNS